MPVTYSAHFADKFHSAGIADAKGRHHYATKRDAMNACHQRVNEAGACARRDAARFGERARTVEALSPANNRYAAERAAEADTLDKLRGKLASAIPAASVPGAMLDCSEGAFRVFVRRHG